MWGAYSLFVGFGVLDEPGVRKTAGMSGTFIPYGCSNRVECTMPPSDEGAFKCALTEVTTHKKDGE